MYTGGYLQMFELRNYQEFHIDKLHSTINESLKLDAQHLHVLKSPTGSGKTIMVAELIKRLVDNRDDKKEIAFIWIAVHKLHDSKQRKT